jgi:hypothetical protein
MAAEDRMGRNAMRAGATSDEAAQFLGRENP